MDYLKGNELKTLVIEDILSCLENTDYFRELSNKEIADLIACELMKSIFESLHDDYENDIDEAVWTAVTAAEKDILRKFTEESERNEMLKQFYTT